MTKIGSSHFQSFAWRNAHVPRTHRLSQSVAHSDRERTDEQWRQERTNQSASNPRRPLDLDSRQYGDVSIVDGVFMRRHPANGTFLARAETTHASMFCSSATAWFQVNKKYAPRPGIEPGPPEWESGILTPRPSGRYYIDQITLQSNDFTQFHVRADKTF